MAKKFQVGDVVKIIKKGDGTFPKNFKVGEKCVVIGYENDGTGFPYYLKRLSGRIKNWFMPCELKLVRRAKKK